MSEEIKFTELPCGCEWSPVAGLKMSVKCDEGEDYHQPLIKAELAKTDKKDK